MSHVRDVMTQGAQVAAPRETLAEASLRMRDHNIGALPVWEGGQLMGIITDRDIAVRAIAAGQDPRQAQVGDVMTKQVVPVYDDQPIDEAAKLMERHAIRRLPVLNRAGRLVGMVTMSDLAVDAGDDRLAAGVLEHVSTAQRALREPYNRIVVTLDGSELAERVLPHVTPIARAFGSTLTLLRVVSPAEASTVADTPSMMHALPSTEVADVVGHLRRDVASYLAGIEHRLIADGLTVECEHPEGRPAEVIVRRARHLGADLIAMTTHGRGAIGRVVFGSVAAEVLRAAPCPVLLICIHEGERQ